LTAHTPFLRLANASRGILLLTTVLGGALLAYRDSPFGPSPAEAAAEIHVNTSLDEFSDPDPTFTCSLREAIQAANINAPFGGCGADIGAFEPGGADVIQVPDGLIFALTIAGTGEDANATGDLDILEGVTLNGFGTAASVIDAGDIDRVLHVHAGSSTLMNITIRNGSAPSGGGIFVASDAGLTLNNSTATANNATLDISGAGGGIFNGVDASLTLLGSTISNNTAGDPQTDNIASGGGIFNGGGSVLVSQSTVSGNTAEDGGGIFNVGSVAAFNSTFSGNTGSNGGGAIYNNGANATSSLILTNVTITANSSGFGAVFNHGPVATTSLTNTIVADQSSGVDCMDDDILIVSNGNNLDSDDTCNLGLNDAPSNNANLGPLQDNGGNTFTHALLPGSDALEGGNNVICGSAGVASVDQRGITRPIGPACDIGAFEAPLTTLNPPTLTKTASPTQVPEAGAIVTFTIVIQNLTDQPLSVDSLTDDQFGNLNGVGTCVIGGVIPSLGSSGCSFQQFLSGAGGTTHTNTVTAELRDTFEFLYTPEDDAVVNFFAAGPTPSPSQSPSPSASPSPSQTPTPSAEQASQRPPNIGAGLSGLFNGIPTPLPTAAHAVAPSATIRPPSTGDGGLK
jgi:CSLREA domain-containing protein